MKKIIAMILIVMSLIGCNKKEEKIIDVIEVNETTYAELYENKTVYKEFDNELECAETYTDAWYEIHDVLGDIEIVDVEQLNEFELILHYSNGDMKKLKYDTEIECAETYSNIYYAVFDGIEVSYN